MVNAREKIIELETKFWQSIVDQQPDVAIGMLTEPALMVSSKGAMQFDHEDYRRMALQGPMTLKSFELSDMEVVFPTDTTAVLTYHARQTMVERGKSHGGTTEDVNDTSTWVKTDGAWKCVAHTEAPAQRASH
jgi:hypothetical protein